MDFAQTGATPRDGTAFSAHVQWSSNAGKRNIYGSRRPDEDSAKKDLQSMRTAVSGMGREEGFAAMEAEANRLKEGKAPIEPGSVILFGDRFAACIKWDEAGTVRRAYGPRRAEKRRAEEDLEALREASPNQADPAARRAALAAEAHRLQQLAEREVNTCIGSCPRASTAAAIS